MIAFSLLLPPQNPPPSFREKFQSTNFCCNIRLCKFICQLDFSQKFNSILYLLDLKLIIHAQKTKPATTTTTVTPSQAITMSTSFAIPIGKSSRESLRSQSRMCLSLSYGKLRHARIKLPLFFSATQQTILSIKLTHL